MDATMALAKGARMQGVQIIEGITVANVTTTVSSRNYTERRVSGVVLSDGRTIQADIVVNCGGMWARQFGQLAGVNIPNQAAEHYYLVTDAMPGGCMIQPIHITE